MSTKALFELGSVVYTPAALAALGDAGVLPQNLLIRHVTGDWGNNLSKNDRDENDFSVKHGYRILSAYDLPTDVRIWIITEADRSATTFLLPEEY